MNHHFKILSTILSHYNPISFFLYRYDNLNYLTNTGKQISKLAEELGPIFIKLLQGITYRIDIFPKQKCKFSTAKSQKRTVSQCCTRRLSL
jgi:predicted unusual protein kinase regulating ubiquinone biosynthesis (AarF/ABC1/UbiB family)